MIQLALKGLGVSDSDRVGTFCWNNQEHVEAYFAIQKSLAGDEAPGVILGVEGSDWETVVLETSTDFWKLIEARRQEPTVSGRPWSMSATSFSARTLSWSTSIAS